jgi:hypothetical protein
MLEFSLWRTVCLDIRLVQTISVTVEVRRNERTKQEQNERADSSQGDIHTDRQAGMGDEDKSMGMGMCIIAE